VRLSGSGDRRDLGLPGGAVLDDRGPSDEWLAAAQDWDWLLRAGAYRAAAGAGTGSAGSAAAVSRERWRAARNGRSVSR
jgi:hypothetical protein